MKIRDELRCELARRNFFYYCNTISPDFYKEDREYIKKTCDELQDFYESDDDVLILCLPPRFGKSRTASNLTSWIFGKNKDEKVMTGSYNEKLSITFSKAVRNAIQEQKGDEDKIVYSDIFPGVNIKRGDGAMDLWSLEGGYNNYIATSPTGTATGFGATVLIVDDLIKNNWEAYNEALLQERWDWFRNTLMQRLEEGGKIFIIMTRWATNDLAGKAMEHFGQEKKKCRVISMQALQEDGTMLCPEILSRESYEMKTRIMGQDIASANYQQIPVNIKGRLYTTIKTYDELPVDAEGNSLLTRIVSYTDTADLGTDNYTSIIAGEYNGDMYVLDVIHTKEPMEVTEPATAAKLFEYKVNLAWFESNNGGRGVARSVERILKETFKTNKTVIQWFHQSKNKRSRILSNATWVMEHIYMPNNWKVKWPDYYKDMTTYQREGKNIHDDAPDATTGLAEKFTTQNEWGWRKT